MCPSARALRLAQPARRRVELDARVIDPRQNPERHAPAGIGLRGDARHQPPVALIRRDRHLQVRAVQVRGGDAHRAVAARLVRQGLDAPVPGVADQHRAQHAAAPVAPLARAEAVALGQFPRVRTRQLQPAQDLRPGLPEPLPLLAAHEPLHRPPQHRPPHVRERRPEVRRRQHHQVLHRRRVHREVPAQPVAHDQRAGRMHDHVAGIRRARQPVIVPGPVQRRLQVVEAQIVAHRQVIAERNRANVAPATAPARAKCRASWANEALVSDQP
jgi:hypothetical protein